MTIQDIRKAFDIANSHRKAAELLTWTERRGREVWEVCACGEGYDVWGGRINHAPDCVVVRLRNLADQIEAAAIAAK